MNRPLALAAAAGSLMAFPALAHHGWSFFNTAQPLYLSGTVREVRWRNPHPEIELEVRENISIPQNVRNLRVPEELQALGDYREVLAKLRVPENAARTWTVVLAPTNRLQSWGMPEAPMVGSTMRVIGYASCDEDGELRPDLVMMGEHLVRQRSVELPAQTCGN